MEKYSIYWYNFRYEDASKETKRRPVLVLDTDILLPIAKITSKEPRDSSDYRIVEWEVAGLDKPSVVRFGKQLLIVRNTLLADDYIGKLSDIDIENIKELQLESLNEDFSVADFSEDTADLIDTLISLDEEPAEPIEESLLDAKKKKAIDRYNKYKEWDNNAKTHVCCECNISEDQLNEWIGE